MSTETVYTITAHRCDACKTVQHYEWTATPFEYEIRTRIPDIKALNPWRDGWRSIIIGANGQSEDGSSRALLLCPQCAQQRLRV